MRSLEAADVVPVLLSDPAFGFRLLDALSCALIAIDLPPTTTTQSHGSGVGLATAQKIAASHGGVLELESASPGGAVFRVRLPVEGRAA